MIKKIRLIKQVGVFADFDDGNDKEFDKLTFIYGLNTHGKSTLCDIFKSLATQNHEIISNRRTRPKDENKKQIVVLSIEEHNLSKEKKILFQNDKWINNDINKNFEIFDTAFVSKNVFNGLSLLEYRETKENFTDFILGAEGVKLANELESNRKKLRSLKNELKSATPDYVNNKNEFQIHEFIKLKVVEKIETLNNEVAIYMKQKMDLEENIKNKEKVLNLPEPSKISIINFDTLRNAIDDINKILGTSFDNLKEEAIEKLHSHIKQNLKDDNEAENWIKKGISYIYNNNCPFCGQDLIKTKKLIGAYQSYFNEEYISFIEKVNNNLDRHISSLSVSINAENAINQTLLKLKDYMDKIDTEKFKNIYKEIEELKPEIPKAEKNIIDIVTEIKSSFEKLAKTKKQKPYCATKPVDKKILLETINQHQSLVVKINNRIDEAIKDITTYKYKFRENTAADELLELTKKIRDLEKKKARIEQDNKCQEYIKINTDIKNVNEEVVALSSRLETEQHEYLDKYFISIDTFFKQLGSKNYKIQRSRPSNRGDKKVYGITIKFKGTNVSNADLPYVFGESDRRALALSIFWAKIHNISDDEKKKKIIILDDPITSFDDNRIIKNNNIIYNFKDKVDQIILFTHYPSFIKEFYKRFNPNDRCVFIKIRQNNSTSYFEKMNIDFFCSNEMEQQFYIISNFISKKSSEDIRQKLRPYLENHVKAIFFKYLSENNLFYKKLEEKINKLHEGGLIEEAIKDRLHRYRRQTNPEGHIFTTNNEEDIRSFAEGMLDFLYSIKLEGPAD